MKVRTGVFAAAIGAALLAGAPALAADQCIGVKGSHRLSVQVTGVRAAEGEVAVTIYPDDARRFLAPHGKLLRSRVKAEAPATSACFWLPGPAVYAIAVYHDANGDHDFNRTGIGTPAEGYGFSNDAPSTVGFPAFEKVRFSVSAGESVTAVRLRYPR